VKLSGYMENMQIAYGSSGNYAGTCASSACILDVAGLHQQKVVGLAGFIAASTATMKNVPSARLDNNNVAVGTMWYADGSGSWLQVAPGTNGQVPTWNGSGVISAQTPGTAGADPPGYVDPVAHGYLAWSLDPSNWPSGTFAPQTTKPLYVLIPVPSALVVNNISIILATAGSGTTWTSGGNGLALVDASGNRLGASADLSTALASQGANTELKASIGTNIAVAAGYCYAVLLMTWSAGTTPAIVGPKAVSAAMQNVGLAAGAARQRAAFDTNARTVPIPVNKAITSLSQNQGLMWAALS
jgi:hypothetical protein